ncbi:urea carboxylase-associated family protein [Ruicaihuangia caeni]|uniref:urea carboxylase-associated family protein n=1 Tax=Ruicaihuangia caeni TaxID=3042517 RepID=UPI00338DB715
MSAQAAPGEGRVTGVPEVIDIPPATGRAVTLAAGDVLRVIDVEGSQVADLVVYAASAPHDGFSQGFTRLLLDRVDVRPGDSLLTAAGEPLLTLVGDTVGVHDILFPPCNRMMYERVFGIPGKTGCREHLTEALAPHGIGFDRVTDPFNVFMNTRIGDDKRMTILLPTSRAGDYVDLRADQDVIVAVSACAADANDCNAGELTGIRLEVTRGKGAS